MYRNENTMLLHTETSIHYAKGAITSKIKHAIKLKTSPATVVQVLQDLFYVLLHVLFYL